MEAELDVRLVRFRRYNCDHLELVETKFRLLAHEYLRQGGSDVDGVYLSV